MIKPYGAKSVALLPHLKRPQPIRDSRNVLIRHYRVRYDDIDINRHVNNAKYLSWMCDLLSPHFLTVYSPRRVELKFSREVRYGTVITSRLKVIRRPNAVITKHEIISHHRLAAVANIRWAAN